jgi:hypothetical protein
LKKRRDEMYALRSGILHGDQLISFDEGRAFGWDPPWRKQNDLHKELWTITRIAMRNYLLNPGAAKLPAKLETPPTASPPSNVRRKLSGREVALLLDVILAAAAIGAGIAILLGLGGRTGR